MNKFGYRVRDLTLLATQVDHCIGEGAITTDDGLAPPCM